MNHIFICYRREDAADVTGRIHDRLREHFGEDAIFIDVDKIPLGVDFRAALDEKVSRCKVLLPVIGRNWLNVKDRCGKPRLHDPNDFVRIEIEAALRLDIPVIPLLVHRVAMPSRDDLPDSLQELAYRQGTKIRPDPDFHKDMDRLINALEQHLHSLNRPSSSSKAATMETSGTGAKTGHADLADLAGLANLYIEGLSCFYTENWDKAIEVFEKIIAVDPAFESVAEKHRQATQQKKMSLLYEEASTSSEKQAWGEAIYYLDQLVALDANYRDAGPKLQEARLKLQLSDYYSEAQRLKDAKKWQAAIAVLDRIAALDSSYPDRDGIRDFAQHALEAQARESKLADWYRQAVRKLDQGQLIEALQAFEEIEKFDQSYRETAALLSQVRQRLAKQEAAKTELDEQKQQLAFLYDRVKSHCTNREYAEAAKLIARIENIDTEYKDIQSVKNHVERQTKSAKRFKIALKLLQRKRWDKAIEVLELLSTADPDYQDSVTSMLLEARSEREKSSLPEPPSRTGAGRPTTFPEEIRRSGPADQSTGKG